MAKSLKDSTIKEFANLLASDSPAPGGGSVSALVGQLAACLGQMVVALTVDKKSFKTREDYEKANELITSAAARLKSFGEELHYIIDEDSQSFNAFLAARQLPKSTEAEKAARNKAIVEATDYCIAVPEKTANLCLKILGELDVIMQYGNKNAMSDTVVAAVLSEAAVNGAIFNVMINASQLEDKTRAKALNKWAMASIDKAKTLRATLVDASKLLDASNLQG